VVSSLAHKARLACGAPKPYQTYRRRSTKGRVCSRSLRGEGGGEVAATRGSGQTRSDGVASLCMPAAAALPIQTRHLPQMQALLQRRRTAQDSPPGRLRRAPALAPRLLMPQPGGGMPEHRQPRKTRTRMRWELAAQSTCLAPKDEAARGRRLGCRSAAAKGTCWLDTRGRPKCRRHRRRGRTHRGGRVECLVLPAGKFLRDAI
jgi:hypothetical protein